MGHLEPVPVKDELLHLISSTMEWGEDTGCKRSRHLDAGVNLCVILGHLLGPPKAARFEWNPATGSGLPSKMLYT